MFLIFLNLNYHLSLFLGGVRARREAIFRRSVDLSICFLDMLEGLSFTVITVPSFGVLGDFPSFRCLGFRGVFRISAVPRFHLLGFRGIFRHSVF